MTQVLTYVMYFGLLVLALAGLILLLRFVGRRRQRALRQAAEVIGFRMTPEDDAKLASAPPKLHLFSVGRTIQLVDTMQGTVGDCPAKVFDYTCQIGRGRGAAIKIQTVCLFEAPGFNLPAFVLSAKGIGGALMQLFGMKGIEVSGCPEFSKKYVLRATEAEGPVRERFTPTALAWFANHPGWNVEGNGSQLMIYRMGRNVKPQKLAEFLASAREVLAQFQ